MTLECTPDGILAPIVSSNWPGCCAPHECSSEDVELCPVSRTKGVKVAMQTVKAMLTESGLARVSADSYRFCPDSGCGIVYFGERGQTYSTSEVRAAVWQKQSEGARTVCYCFGENEADIRAEITATGQSDAVERVRQHIQAGRCACEVRNPRGVCCLGDVAAAVKRAAAAMAAPVSLPDKSRSRLEIQ